MADPKYDIGDEDLSADDALEASRYSSSTGSPRHINVPVDYDPLESETAVNKLSPKITRGEHRYERTSDSSELYEEGEEGVAYTFALPKENRHYDEY